MRRVLTGILLSFASVSVVASTDASRWWSHVTFLADDALEGRETGSAGHRRAAEYVANHFRDAGLTPGAGAGYIQPVKFRSRTVDEAHCRLALVRDGAFEPLVLGDEATLSMRIEHASSVEAPLVFVGYGLSIPDLNYDDLAGLDLRGKVVVYLGGGPSNVPGPLLSHAQSGGERWAALRRAGAVGTIAIPNPRGMDIPWERSMLSRFMPSMALADPSLDETAGQKLAVTVNPARADKVFAGSGHSITELLALADAGQRLPIFALPSSIRAEVAFTVADVESQNVVGILPGTDAALKDEYVVLSAHLDHVGLGRPINGDGLYNGAMDNASGVATLLEVAARMHESKRRFRRSVVFLAVTGEEKGLLGSRYFANHPTVRGEAMVANINTDMFLPIFPLNALIAHGVEESDLGPELRTVVEPFGVRVLVDPEPERNAFIRSDQYSFIRRGVPSISMKVGYEKGSPEAALAKTWRTERYHAPSDDTRQPVDLTAAARFNDLMLAFAGDVADRPTRPRWNPDSFFKRFAQTPVSSRH